MRVVFISCVFHICFVNFPEILSSLSEPENKQIYHATLCFGETPLGRLVPELASDYKHYLGTFLKIRWSLLVTFFLAPGGDIKSHKFVSFRANKTKFGNIIYSFPFEHHLVDVYNALIRLFSGFERSSEIFNS